MPNSPAACDIVIGIGCQRGVMRATVATALDAALTTLGAVCVRGLATHAQKATEPALLELAAQHGWPLWSYPAQILASIAVPHPSAGVARTVGTPSVAEAAALCASNGGTLLIAKQIVRGADGKSVTLAVARWRDPSAPRCEMHL